MSPSSEEFLVEGTHSIDGISADLGSAETSTLWVSSISAGKMWELDANLLPVRTLKVLTLPYQVGNLGPCLPASGGLYGAGRVLMSQITESRQETVFKKSKAGTPVLSVGVGSESSGVHFYPSSSAASILQTDPLECTASTALSSWKEHRLATCSVFGSGNFFGISPICLPLTALLPMRQDEFPASSVISAMLMTARGDIYSYAVLVSTKGLSPNQLSRLTRQAVPAVGRIERKLVGGMNVSLGVPALAAAPMGVSSSKTKKNNKVELRPFKTSDLRSMQPGEQSAEDHLISTTHVIDAISTNNDYLVKHGNVVAMPNEPNQRLISSSVKSAERELLVYRCPSWLNSTNISDIDQDADEKGRRSDVNSQVLKLVQGSKLDS